MSLVHGSRSLALLLATALVAACAAPPPKFDATAEGAKLLKRDVEWSDLATAGQDTERIVSYWSDDAVVIEPGQAAVEGKTAIRAFVARSLKTPGFRIHWVSQPPTFSPDGKLAYLRGATEVTMPGAKGAPITLHLQGYTIWRVERDGQWRCVVDIYTEAPAPGAATAK